MKGATRTLNDPPVAGWDDAPNTVDSEGIGKNERSTGSTSTQSSETAQNFRPDLEFFAALRLCVTFSSLARANKRSCRHTTGHAETPLDESTLHQAEVHTTMDHHPVVNFRPGWVMVG